MLSIIYAGSNIQLAKHATKTMAPVIISNEMTTSLLVQYWFSEDQLTQSNPFCTSIISSYQITRAHSDIIIIKNRHCSQIITYFGWCKCHDEFRITTSLYPYFIFKAVFTTCYHSFPYSWVLNVRALTPCILTPSGFLKEHVMKHNHKPTATPLSTLVYAVDNHFLSTFTSLALVPSPPPSENQWDRYLNLLEERILSPEQ